MNRFAVDTLDFVLENGRLPVRLTLKQVCSPHTHVTAPAAMSGDYWDVVRASWFWHIAWLPCMCDHLRLVS